MKRRLAEPPLARLSALSAALAAGLALAACSEGDGSGGQGRLSGELTLTGSSTAAPIITQVGLRFEKRHPGVEVAVQAGGSSRGIADARRGTADIGMSSRALHAGEKQGLDQHPFARDGVALILHSRNPVTALQSSDVVGLFTGKIESWQNLGGADQPVSVIHKSAGRATRAVFLEHFDLGAEAVTADAIVGSNQQAMQAVAGEPGAVGYVSIGHARHEIERGLELRLPRLDGVAPTSDKVAKGRYPLTRPLVLITPRGELSRLQRAFIDFARSERVHDLIAEFGYVPIQG